MERSIKISVVIPVYNTAKYIEECLDSLYVQEYKNVEYLLIDDGSTDESLNICMSYAQRDERFVVVHKENGGPSSARNLAISMAKGEYISFVDSDDSVVENAYATIDKRLRENGNPDILIFGANLFPKNAPDNLRHMVSPRRVTFDSFSPEILYEEVGSRPFLWLQVIKKSLIEEQGIKMDEEMNLGEDQLFQIALFPFAKKISYVEDKLYNYRWYRPNSLMNDYGEKKKKKLLTHVMLVDKVLETIFTPKYDENMWVQTFAWSVFFMWGDVVYLLEYDQGEVAGALCDVWEKHNCKSLYDQLGVWSKLRYDQLCVLGEPDKDKKIEDLERVNEELEKRLSELMKMPECKRLAKSKNTKSGKFKRAMRKFFDVWKKEGFFRAIKKGLKKIKTKLFK